ncbi:MAG: cation diffusion facilitator family transporter, partial [Myxococcota bacterium]
MTDRTANEARTRAIQRVLVVTFLLNLVVAGAKVVYGTASGALAIRADGFHSIADSMNNVIAFVAISLAARPPDDDHPYGHRKHEVLAAAVIGVSLLLIAFDVCKDALQRLMGEATPPSLDDVA